MALDVNMIFINRDKKESFSFEEHFSFVGSFVTFFWSRDSPYYLSLKKKIPFSNVSNEE